MAAHPLGHPQPMKKTVPDNPADIGPAEGHCLVFDIGKTNKKAFILDRRYQVVASQADVLPETTDEDGFPCEDLTALRHWVLDTMEDLLRTPEGSVVRAINCTAYGASLVHLDGQGDPVTPLYNYLKPCPAPVEADFFRENGPRETLSLATASPVLGFLNSGLQLYSLYRERPAVYRKIRWSLHLPQYLAWLLAGEAAKRTGRPSAGLEPADEHTSLGCHTFLWDFRRNDYHAWVRRSGLIDKFPPLRSQSAGWTFPWRGRQLRVGIGLHDSSAALIPYQLTNRTPFLLLSTGTWCITLNPFNRQPLTAAELAADCLCYRSYHGEPVKAARYFGGNRHDEAVRAIARRFGVPADFHLDPPAAGTTAGGCRTAYRQLVEELVREQVASLTLVREDTTGASLYVDGGFSHNEQFMEKLAAALPDCPVYAARVAQASALGAALAVREHWNPGPVPDKLIDTRRVDVNTRMPGAENAPAR